jgi:hypothetical protein
MYAEVREMETYKIVRFYFRGGRRTIDRGMTLEEAQTHCSNPETSSKTSTRRAYTARVGPWFDGYERE